MPNPNKRFSICDGTEALLVDAERPENTPMQAKPGAVAFQPQAVLDGAGGEPAHVRSTGEPTRRLVCRDAGQFLLKALEAAEQLGADAGPIWQIADLGLLLDADELEFALRDDLRWEGPLQVGPSGTDLVALWCAVAPTSLAKDADPGLQFSAVGSAILERASVPVDPGKAQHFLHFYDGEFARRCKALRKSIPDDDALPWESGRLRVQADGTLDVSRDAEEHLLAEILPTLVDQFGSSLTLPGRPGSIPPASVCGWGGYAAADPRLRAWFALKNLDGLRHAALLRQFSIAAGARPFLSCGPVPEADHSLLTSGGDGQLVRVRLADLTLAAFATVSADFQHAIHRHRERGDGKIVSLASVVCEHPVLPQAGVSADIGPEVVVSVAEAIALGIGQDAAVAYARTATGREITAATVMRIWETLGDAAGLGFDQAMLSDLPGLLGKAATGSGGAGFKVDGLMDAIAAAMPAGLRSEAAGSSASHERHRQLSASALHAERVLLGEGEPAKQRKAAFAALKKAAADAATRQMVEGWEQNPAPAEGVVQLAVPQRVRNVRRPRASHDAARGDGLAHPQ